VRVAVVDDLPDALVVRVVTEFTWGERTGYGIAEYIERVEDGAPVGWPL
jgi:hypothetical protein